MTPDSLDAIEALTGAQPRVVDVEVLGYGNEAQNIIGRLIAHAADYLDPAATRANHKEIPAATSNILEYIGRYYPEIMLEGRYDQLKGGVTDLLSDLVGEVLRAARQDLSNRLRTYAVIHLLPKLTTPTKENS